MLSLTDGPKQLTVLLFCDDKDQRLRFVYDGHEGHQLDDLTDRLARNGIPDAKKRLVTECWHGYCRLIGQQQA